MLPALLLHCTYLLTVLKNPRFLIPFSFRVLVGDSRFTIPLTIVLHLSFCLRVTKVAIVICLLFCAGGCAILKRLAFRDHELPFLWFAVVNRLGDCDPIGLIVRKCRAIDCYSNRENVSKNL